MSCRSPGSEKKHLPDSQNSLMKGNERQKTVSCKIAFLADNSNMNCHTYCNSKFSYKKLRWDKADRMSFYSYTGIADSLSGICDEAIDLYIKIGRFVCPTGSVSKCRTTGMPIMSHCQPYADHVALRPHAAVFGRRHCTRSA